MRVPASPYGVSSLSGLIEWLRVFATAVASGWAVNHRSDGTHKFPWATQAYDANRFTGSSAMTWGVDSADQEVNRYSVIDHTLFWTARISNTDVGGTASGELRIALPGEYVAAYEANWRVAYLVDAGVLTTGFVNLQRGVRYARVLRSDLANFTLTTGDNTTVYFSLVCEVQ